MDDSIKSLIGSFWICSDETNILDNLDHLKNEINTYITNITLTRDDVLNDICIVFRSIHCHRKPLKRWI